MKKIFLFLLAPIVFNFACKPNTPAPGPPATPPAAKACFSTNKIVFDSGETISFTNCSTNASKYAWNFGDGSSAQSADANPTWTYGAGGRPKTGYVVTLAAFNSAGKEKDSVTHIYEGLRMFDSVRLNSLTGFTPAMSLLFQFGPIQFALEFTPNGGNVTVATLPHTYSLAASNVGGYPVIVPGAVSTTNSALNNSSWRGKIVSNPPTVNRTFGLTQSSLIYLSRGTPGASSVHVSDNGVDLDFYYHMIKP